MTGERPAGPPVEDLQPLERILAGEVRTIARTLSRLEDGDDTLTPLLAELFRRSGEGFVVGITGSPGAGKSTLVDHLAGRYSRRGEKVGILAVDPSSPFSGGAILGDRVRMQSLTPDPNVFIRSMATRGHMGGLAWSVNEALLVLEAAGYRRLLVETVGAGQDEVEIVRTAQATVVVLVPGMGDDIQTIKAGIMEIGDIFVINKADRPESDRSEREVRALLAMSERPDGWEPPLLKTVATQGKGIEELAGALERYRAFLEKAPAGQGHSRERFRLRLMELLRERLQREILRRIPSARLDLLVEKMMTREEDPYTIIEGLMEGFCQGGDS